MSNQELFYKIEKLIDDKIKSEESSYEKQNKILRELLNEKHKIKEEDLNKNTELQNKIDVLILMEKDRSKSHLQIKTPNPIKFTPLHFSSLKKCNVNNYFHTLGKYC